jgi:penicillin-insensitive murein endopeptidase
MLTEDRQHVDRRYWSARQGEILRLAVDFPEVERIFVHPVIKQVVCMQFAGAAWIQKLRPWWGHDDHFHVRLRCPEGDGECLRQDPVSEGNGCGDELTWWLTEGIHQVSKGPASSEVRLPAACQEILTK